MKSRSYFQCWLVILVLTWCASVESSKRLHNLNSEIFEDDEQLSSDSSKEDVLIEDNPDFVKAATREDDGNDGDDGSGSDSDGDDDNDDDDINDNNENAARSSLNSELKKAKERSRCVINLVKKNRSRTIAALTVFAFRKEILQLIIYFAKSQIPRTKTTSILKLLLFVHFMRQLQTGDLSSSTGRWFSAFAGSTPGLGSLLSKYNPANLPPIQQHYSFERLNEYYVKDAMALQKAIESTHEGLKWPSSSSSHVGMGSLFRWNPAPSTVASSNQTVVILDWSKQLDLERVGDQVSFLLSEYRYLAMAGGSDGTTANATTSTTSDRYDLEVILFLNSPGGSAADFGVAAQHLLRLRNAPGITLTICVDKVAASGGYMLCCTASPGQLFAAPFAVVGSIGVLGQVINVQNLLEGWGIQPLIFRGGKDKAPVGLIGEISEEGKQTTQSFIDATHKAFKDHVTKTRPMLKNDIEKIGNGDVYLGAEALDMKLIDGIMTGDEYVDSKLKGGARVLKMIKNPRTSFLFGSRYNDASLESKQATLGGLRTSVRNIVEYLAGGSGFCDKARMPASIHTLLSQT